MKKLWGKMNFSKSYGAKWTHRLQYQILSRKIRFLDIPQLIRVVGIKNLWGKIVSPTIMAKINKFVF